MGHRDYQKRTGWRSIKGTAILPALAAVLVSSAAADAASGNGEARTEINQGVNITKNADLHFGDFAAGTNQSRFTIDPDNDALIQLNGNAVSLGGTHSAAWFSAYGTPLERVRMTVSQNQIELTRVGGGQTMRVDQFRFDGGNGTRNRNLNASGSVDYKLGGRLTINANQAAGAYLGTFNVTIDYQ